MKKCIAIFIGIALSMSASAQFLNRFFMQAGGTIGLDFSQFSGIIDGTINRNQQIVNKQVNFATIAFGGRLNVFEFSNNVSLALAVQPLLSFGKAYNDAGGGINVMFRTPCTVDFNIGNAATSKSRSKRGVVFGAGVQWVKYPLFNDVAIFKENTSSGNPLFISMNSNWWEPVFHIGIRNAGKHYYSREVNIRASYITRSSLKLHNVNHLIEEFERFSIMLSILQFLNY